MQTAPFDLPIHVRCASRNVVKIRSPKDAFDFLLSCPTQEGPLYESALEACFSALANKVHHADAYRGLLTFARAHGLLADGNGARSASRNLRVTLRTPAMPQPSQFRGH